MQKINEESNTHYIMHIAFFSLQNDCQYMFMVACQGHNYITTLVFNSDRNKFSQKSKSDTRKNLT